MIEEKLLDIRDGETIFSSYLRDVIECLSESAQSDEHNTQSRGFRKRRLGTASWKRWKKGISICTRAIKDHKRRKLNITIKKNETPQKNFDRY